MIRRAYCLETKNIFSPNYSSGLEYWLKHWVVVGVVVWNI